METVYFHCDECYNDKYGVHACVTDKKMWETRLDSNYLTYTYYDPTCNKCGEIESLINGPKYTHMWHASGHETIVKRENRNFGYSDEFGVFQLSTIIYGFACAELIMTIHRLKRLGSALTTTENIEEISLEQFLDQVKVKSLIVVYSSSCAVTDSTIADIDLSSKNLCIKKVGAVGYGMFFLVVNQPFVKCAIKHQDE